MSMLRAAVVDTDVFSHLYVVRNSVDRRVPRWRELLTGRRVVISFQTRSEVLAGALANGWGDRRLARLSEILHQTPTIRVDDEVIVAHATLLAECRRAGHPLQAKDHTGDRWVAACAIAKGVDLLAGDTIYEGAPGVRLLGSREEFQSDARQ